MRSMGKEEAHFEAAQRTTTTRSLSGCRFILNDLIVNRGALDTADMLSCSCSGEEQL